MELRYKINSRILLVAMIGAIMVCSSYLMFVYNPLALIVKKILSLSPGSIMYNIWTKPPYDVYIKAFIFNVTNPDQFYAGTEKLAVNEIGPYVYKETLYNLDGEFFDNGTVAYRQKRYIEFMPEMSVGDPKVDWLISPNIPLVGISAALQDSSMFVNMAVSSISHYLGSKPFVNVTVHEYLWGYDDPLVELANDVVPNWINFPRFGILDRMMALDNASNSILMNIATGSGPYAFSDEENDPKNAYTIQRYNGSPGLPHWGYVEPENNETIEGNTRCNTIQGTFESGIYPENVNQPNSTFRMYRRAFCRPVKFAYDGEAQFHGYDGYKFRVDKDFLATPEENPDNSCYCVKGVCPPKGMAYLSPCYYDIPVTISQPHFYNADPTLQSEVVGLKPIREKHDSTMILHKGMGVPMQADLKIQINIMVDETKYNSKTKPFNGHTLPLFWLQLNIDEIPTLVNFCILMLFHVLPVVQDVLMYLFAIGGALMVSGSAFALLFIPKTTNARDTLYSPIPILPLATQYFKPEIRVCK